MNEFENWQQRFSIAEYVFGEEPNAFLVSKRNLLAKGARTLAVADGEGRNGVWLAEQGLDVLSLDFSPVAQDKAKSLAAKRNARLSFEIADVHDWAYPENAFDVVVEIFSQFSSPAQRARKWAGMKRTLKAGGLLLIEGYTPKQLEFATGGPKARENLYTRVMLETEFGGFSRIEIEEAERPLSEGAGHKGMSAVIDLVAWK
ncbi:class I SAM-dependent methyltransferase [uncultured Rhodoblastus sp.]|uniref:class I SAM-dependent methyltransferase n=1 Tax=uncultured Rhodoblastus sp. TaxID=543037 RepID=UPI0025D08815|nr:class I SAM-dependent methyltransferase [uncultured Rhodoblastus sp.]